MEISRKMPRLSVESVENQQNVPTLDTQLRKEILVRVSESVKSNHIPTDEKQKGRSHSLKSCEDEVTSLSNFPVSP